MSTQQQLNKIDKKLDFIIQLVFKLGKWFNPMLIEEAKKEYEKLNNE